MQKKKEEQNAKPVGAGLVPAQNKGITLIALIITIIVMLILVGVTINVALNGGLFERAKTAGSQMQKEAEKEELLSAVVAAIGTDGKVDFDYLDRHLPTGEWTGSKGTYTSPSKNTFTVDANGKIEQGNKEKIVSGKIYVGNLTNKDGTIEAAIVFSKKYSNKAFVFYSFGNCDIYTYTEGNMTVSWAGITANISENGKKISYNSADMSLEGKEVDKIPGTEGNKDVIIWDGAYYNEELNKIITVYINETNSLVKIARDGTVSEMGGIGIGNSVQENLNSLTLLLGMTIIDSTHIRQGDYIYTLLYQEEI